MTIMTIRGLLQLNIIRKVYFVLSGDIKLHDDKQLHDSLLRLQVDNTRVFVTYTTLRLTVSAYET